MSSDSARNRLKPMAYRSLIATLAAGAMLSTAYAPAFALPGIDDVNTGSTVANVIVGSYISLTSLSPSFEMNGLPGDSVNASVTYTVETNNAAGYTVTVQAESDLTPQDTTTNIDVIPASDVIVTDRDSTTATTQLEVGTAVPVHTQPGRSATAGDDLQTNFSLTIPFVASDTYSATLDYVATTL